MDPFVLDAVDQGVGGVGAIEPGVLLQSLCGGAGDGRAVDLPTFELPGTGGGREDRALAGPGAPDEEGDPTRAGDRLQRLVLLIGEGRVDLLADLAAGLPQRALCDRASSSSAERSTSARVACSISRRRPVVHHLPSNLTSSPERSSAATNSSASAARQAPAAIS